MFQENNFFNKIFENGKMSLDMLQSLIVIVKIIN